MGSYQVGVDLGTTYTAAAVHRDGEAGIFALGGRTSAVPSVVLLRADGTYLTGDAAERRASSEPDRVVREFKRRFGDTTPIIVGGSPYSAEALTSRLLASVVGQIEAQEGPPPSRIVITYPANWGNYKRELLDQTVRLAGLDPSSVGFITEPEAAALSYAAQERVEPGEVVAVYDLGGGTFDAAVLQRTVGGFAIVGRPEGIDRLGGIDFDAAVLAHVNSSLGDALSAIDPEDPAALMAVTRLRQDCIAAKEALSSDADTSIPVVLPTVQTEVRITRQEFERLIRPSLADSIEAMRRALRSAQLTPEQVSRVLLVGGSSRIPLVAQLVTSELGRPVAVDAHPKHAIALGAAMAAGGVLGDAAPSIPGMPVVGAARSVGPAPGEPVAGPPPSPPPVPRSAAPPARPAGAGPTPGFDPNRTVAAPAGSLPTPPRPRKPAKARPVPLGDLMAPGGLAPPGFAGPPPTQAAPAPRAGVAQPLPSQPERASSHQQPAVSGRDGAQSVTSRTTGRSGGLRRGLLLILVALVVALIIIGAVLFAEQSQLL